MSQAVIPEILADEFGTPIRESAGIPSAPEFPELISRRYRALCFIASAALCLVLPLLFGGVHASVYLSFQIGISALLAATILLHLNETASILKQHSILRRTSACIALFVGVALLQYGWLQFRHVEHPVLGQTSLILNHDHFSSSVRELIFFCSVFFLVSLGLYSTSGFLGRLTRLLMLAGVGVSVVALCHWFYDNGKLFWIFSPEGIFVSERARWPFINPNHLGRYLLPLLFLFFGSLVINVRALTEHTASSVKDMLTNKNVQRGISGTFLSFLALVTVLVTVAATLSRGTWFATAISVSIFLLFYKISHDSRVSSNRKDDSAHPFGRIHHRRHRRSHHRAKRVDLPDRIIRSMRNLEWMLRPFLAVCVLGAVYLLLYGEGSERVEARVEYGLVYSKDDIRWAFYSDTTRMIKDFPLFGVGFGQWEPNYARYMDMALTGINPVYLHSDPMQLLAEMGIVGVFPLLLLSTLLVTQTVRIVKRSAGAERVQIVSLATALFAIFLGSLFDFPFRVPAIGAECAILLAMLVYVLERQAKMLGRG